MPTSCWLKHLCSIRALVPVSCFLSLSPSLFLRLFLWSAEDLWVHFPTRASKTLLRRRSAPSPHWEGAWGLREQSKPRAGALLAFCINQGISASFSLLYFLIIDSGPPGSDPLEDLNRPVQVQFMKQATQSQHTGTTQRGGMGREVGGRVWEGQHMYTCGWFMSMYGQNHHNIVK